MTDPSHRRRASADPDPNVHTTTALASPSHPLHHKDQGKNQEDSIGGGNSEGKEGPELQPDEDFARLLQKLKGLHFHQDHLTILRKSYEYSRKKHAHQRRMSGELYIHHPIEVCSILAELTVDPSCLVAAMLHDTVEDTSAEVEDIEAEFGHEIATLVEGLTKIRRIKFRSNQEKVAENFRKMVLAMAKDLRVVIVKLCDRLHNMRTLGVMDQAKQRRIAQETLDIYAPLANRLGVYGIKSELEDHCLRVLKPEVYHMIAQKVSVKKHERNQDIALVKSQLQQELEPHEFSYLEITGRSKHFFSIYKKMQNRKLTFEEIYDLHAFRVIVGSIKECYEVLGMIHALWKPMPGRFKDYIAMPKANLYQSLHTTVIRAQGSPAEIQIRTQQMHHISEFGVASHWHYKEGEKGQKNTDLNTFRWLRQMMEWQNDITDSGEYIEALKVDLFEHEIFVFSPKGDVYRLPYGSTPLDFAFAIHTDVGLHTRSAKVNQRMISLRHRLKNGDIVEIITSSSQLPGKDWLNLVKTSKAKSKIRSFLRAEQRQQAKAMGRNMFTAELDTAGLTLSRFQKNSSWVEKALQLTRSSNFEDLMIAVGLGKVVPQDVLSKILPQKFALATADTAKEMPSRAQEQLEKARYPRPQTLKTPHSAYKSPVMVSGIDHVLVTLAKCCRPVPGDDICGYITRGRGVTVHLRHCPRALDLDPSRRMEVEWNDKAHVSYHEVNLKVESKEQHGMLAEVSTRIASVGVNVLKANVHVTKNMVGIFQLRISVKDLTQLQGVIGRIESIPGVLSVQRMI